MATKKAKVKAKAKTTKKKKAKKKIDIEDLLGELQARFDVVEEKLDTLLSKSANLSRMISTERDPGFKTQATVTKKFPIPQDRKPRERKMHRVVCAQCKKDCEVPFIPRADRPVYCKACYSDRRNETTRRSIPDKEELVAEIAKTLKLDLTEPPKTKTKAKPKLKAKKPKAKVSKAKAKATVKKTKTKKTKAKK